MRLIRLEIAVVVSAQHLSRVSLQDYPLYNLNAMYSLNNFSLTDMTECGIALRKLGLSANSMESTAQKIVRFFYDSFRDPVSGDSAFAIARFFKTHSYGELAEDLQYQAQRIIQDETVPTDLKCLTLLGTIGDRQEW
jgi:hypothetical protein